MTPYYEDSRVALYVGHVLAVLAGLEAGSVQTVITSPPYFGLRSYGTDPQVWGGSPDCTHALEETAPGKVLTGGTGTASAKQVSNTGSQYGNAWAEQGERTNTAPRDHAGAYGFADTRGEEPHRNGTALTQSLGATCTRCGAWRGELGSEPTIEMFVEHLVDVFRGVKRVLRDDGTLWLNLGSSYSAGVTNLTDSLNRLLEGGSVFFGNAETVTVTAHRVGIATQDQRSPESVLAGLLATERDGIENGYEHLGQIGNALAGPGDAGLRPLVGAVIGDAASAQHVADAVNHRLIIGAELHPQTEAILGILRTPRGRASEDDKATLAVDQTDEPSNAEQVCWYTTWDAFAQYTISKRGVNIDAVNDAIALGNRLDTLSGLLADFRVTQASEQKLTLTSVCGSLQLTITDVGHLWFVLRSGSIVPYITLYKDAIARTNELAAKQDLCIPWRVAMALQRDGWILRSPIIWSKPNPMPESVTDRPTKAHEYLFLLSKQPVYYYDAEAIREPYKPESLGRYAYSLDGTAPTARQPQNGDVDRRKREAGVRDPNPAGRNRRSVWTIPTEAYPAAHFATFPRKLVEPCVLAGTSARGQCPACGAPWRRTTTTEYVKSPVHGAGSVVGRHYATGANGWDGAGLPRLNKQVETTGWAPSCQCDAGDPVPQVCLDPFAGSGTTLAVARWHQRRAVGIELNPEYARLVAQRLAQGVLL